MERSRRFAVLLVLLFLVSLSQSAYSESTGMTGKSVTGCTCHSNSASLSPSMQGLPFGAGGYTPGATYSLSWDGGPHTSGDGGFNLDVSSGSWTNLGAYVQLLNGELTHSSDAARSWSVDWIAPAAGTGDVDFSLAVLYANGNGQNSGDSWGTGAWTLGESSGTGDSAPVASNVTYVPISPTKGTGLGVSYDYHDADGDSEQGTLIKWWRDGLRVSSIDDLTDVPNSWIGRGQQWQVEVTPSDVNQDGEPVMLDPVTIGNTIPIARNLDITPSEPADTDSLTLSYNYYDFDGDVEQSTIIRWYLDGMRIEGLDDSNMVSALMVRAGDEWEARVTPNDGTDYGEIASTGIIIIGSSNTKPTCSIYISPSNPVTDQPLQAIIGWYDADGDNLAGEEIRWFRNGVQISAYNDVEWVPSDATTKDETWTARTRVYDGLIWSEWVDADGITILNSPPVVTSISLLPEGKLITTDNLTVVWEQFDIDGDARDGSEIRWWVNGEWLPEYNGMVTIPANETYRDQNWAVQILPRDGDTLGSGMTTSSRVIENVNPEMPEIVLGTGSAGYLGAPMIFPELSAPNSLESMVIFASSSDVDNDPLFYDVKWSRNGFHVPDLDGESLVPAERLEPGQEWQVTVIVNDPWGLSNEASMSITITNLAPIPAWKTLLESPLAGSKVSLDGSDSIDLDGEVINWIWLVNGVSYIGQSIEVVLGSGTHSVGLTTIDDWGDSASITSDLTLGSVQMVDSLAVNLIGTKVELSWSGIGDDYRIYHSTSPITSVADMMPIGSSESSSWSEVAPVATTVYYAVTQIIDGQEVIWISVGENVVNIDATAASGASDNNPTGSILFLQLPLILLFISMAIGSMTYVIVGRRRS
jgi:hypothetical protein